MEKVYARNDRLLRKKFNQYLLPTMATYAALSLNEFLDSMLVSNLLGSDAMAIVNLGMPLMLLMAAVYCMLGSGAATVYAVSLGKRDHETAANSLTSAMTCALLFGVGLLALGNIFFGPFSGLLCHDAALMPQFKSYLRVLFISSPFLVTILTFTSILPSAGYPGYSMTVNIVANVVNIIMDYVYIRFFHMGVEGAAWATLTGYLAGLLYLLLLGCMKKLKVYATRKIIAAFKGFRKVIAQGAPDAMTQIGFSLQFAVCNTLAAIYAGSDGIIALSLCIQANSITSIFLGTLIGSSVPLLSVLHGQRDYIGEKSILKRTMLGQLLICVLSVLLFWIFAPQVAAIYNITEAGALHLAVHALRIYILMYLARGAIIIFFRYLKVAGFTGYAMLVSALDGFAAIIPIAWLLSTLFGIDGLWWAFPAASVLILLFMLIRNRSIAKHSKGRWKSLLLFEDDESSTPVLDVTIEKDAASIAGISETICTICEENGINRRDAVRAAVAIEEMAVYVAGKKDQKSYMDILVRIYKGSIEIDFRSLGTVFDPLADADEDCTENVRLLRGIATSIENEYTLGMNATRIVIAGSKNDAPAA